MLDRCGGHRACAPRFVDLECSTPRWHRCCPHVAVKEAATCSTRVPKRRTQPARASNIAPHALTASSSDPLPHRAAAAAHAPPTVSDTRRKFIEGYRRPIPAVYK